MDLNVDFPIVLLDISGVDEQHLALADLLNRLAAVVRAMLPSQVTVTVSEEAVFADCRGLGGVPGDPELFGEALHLLRQLEARTAEHFVDEEAVMEEAGFPGLNEHRREHLLLMAELREFVRAVSSGAESLELCHLVALRNWFVGHIVVADMEFSRFFHGGPPTSPPLGDMD